ncbi:MULTISPECIES: GNAT family N-acetyltransferase [Mumia]|uniref:GNAT family N-acetyltransferase n=1 Tax=Mumia TaxID=1546255 RepID=UPI001422DBCE|nr:MULTISPECIES: GNAT family N-acetyltransferase [unclassified Mumia]QMW67585.1 GNAT family N-acetyltransferase [Mumia sp. ZJ1417]
MRPAACEDVEAIREIERAADERFREIGLGFVADGEPTSYEAVSASVDRGTTWVEVGDDGVPVAFALADVVDGRAHLEQLSVLPSHAGRGIGAALVDTVERWARTNEHDVLTLTTFADVPWNAPYFHPRPRVVMAKSLR